MTSRQSGWHRPDSWGVGVSWLRHQTAVWQVISAQRGGVSHLGWRWGLYWLSPLHEWETHWG